MIYPRSDPRRIVEILRAEFLSHAFYTEEFKAGRGILLKGNGGDLSGAMDARWGAVMCSAGGVTTLPSDL